MKIAIGVEYCGTGIHGWQRQKQTPTVQECVEQALSSVADHPVSVFCAGRTDAGVHALHQVIHFQTSAKRELHAWILGGNTLLPAAISLLWSRQMDDDFHARFSAIGRTYRYVIINRRARPGMLHGRVSWEYRPLDVERMKVASRVLIGKHDFTSFRALRCQAKSPVREIRRLDIYRRDEFIVIEVEANAFLHHMVRNIAGVLMAIGAGKQRIDWCEQVLEARDRCLGGVTASPDGLYLIDVEYAEKYNLPTQSTVGMFDFVGAQFHEQVAK